MCSAHGDGAEQNVRRPRLPLAFQCYLGGDAFCLLQGHSGLKPFQPIVRYVTKGEAGTYPLLTFVIS